MFDEESFVQNKKTGVKIPVDEVEGAYVMKMWIQKKVGAVMKAEDEGDTDEETMVFVRQGEAMI